MGHGLLPTSCFVARTRRYSLVFPLPRDKESQLRDQETSARCTLCAPKCRDIRSRTFLEVFGFVVEMTNIPITSSTREHTL